MNPYYQDEWVTLYLGDCLQVTDWLAADVLVTDPPYGIGYESGRVPTRTRTPIAGDLSTETRDAVLGVWGDKPALVFGAWDQPRPEHTRHRLLWSKEPDPGMGDLSMPWGRSDEEVYVLGYGWVGQRGPNIIRCPKPPVNNRDAHPTPKPVALMESLLRKCPPGTIADPFAGSGSTLVAAKALGRKAIGVELEERYCEIAARRLAQDVLDFGGGVA